MKTALITAVASQDGSFLAEHLLKLGYRVVGTIRRSPAAVPWLLGMLDQIEFVYMDMRDPTSMEACIMKSWPDEIYNFAAHDGVALSWNHSEDAMDVIYGGLARLIKIVMAVKKDVRIYQASSASMFGNAKGACDEHTKRAPIDPYGIAKTAAHELAELYRGLGLHISCGICLNHESERRYPDRASKKIAMAAAKWAMGSEEPLMFGTTSSRRDWGFAGDYVKAFHSMLQQNEPDDYVIGTGKDYSVLEFIQACGRAAGISNVTSNMIKTDERLVRKNDVKAMVANPEKIQTKIGWVAETNLEQLAERMVQAEMSKLKRAKAAA